MLLLLLCGHCSFTILLVLYWFSFCRYYDRFNYNYRPGYAHQTYNQQGYGQQQNVAQQGYGSQRDYEDRNWYYQPDRYDERNRFGDRNSNRYAI